MFLAEIDKSLRPTNRQALPELDELIRAVKGARTGMVRLEELTEGELRALTSDFEKLRTRLAATGQEPSAASNPE